MTAQGAKRTTWERAGNGGYWFARAPSRRYSNAMMPISLEGWIAYGLCLGLVLFAIVLLAVIGQMHRQPIIAGIVALVVTGAAVAWYSVIVARKSDRTHTVKDYKLGRVAGGAHLHG